MKPCVAILAQVDFFLSRCHPSLVRAMSLPSLEAGYAAAAAEVARLSAELIVAKQSVSWYAAALRRQTRQKLEAQYQEGLLVGVQQQQQVEESADKTDVDDDLFAGLLEEEGSEGEEESEQEEGEATEEEEEEEKAAEAEKVEEVKADEGRKEQVAAEQVHEPQAVQRAAPRHRKVYGAAPPEHMCPACWNELRAGWAGMAHRREYPFCRVAQKLKKEEFLEREAKLARLA